MLMVGGYKNGCGGGGGGGWLKKGVHVEDDRRRWLGGPETA